MNPWEEDWSAAAPSKPDVKPWEENWDEVEPVTVTATNPNAPIATARNENVLTDALKSFGTGVMQGVTGLPGLPGDVLSLVNSGTNWAADKVGLPGEGMTDKEARTLFPGIGGGLTLPTSHELNDFRQQFMSKDYQPQSGAGEFARGVGQFVGPGGVVGGALKGAAGVARGGTMLEQLLNGARGAGIGTATGGAGMIVPGVTSEAAGAATEGTPVEGFARFAGGVLGGSLMGGGRAALERSRVSVEPMLKPFLSQDPAKLEAAATNYRASDIQPTLADVVSRRGQGQIRAAATVGGDDALDTVGAFREGRAQNLPDRIKGQGERLMSNDPRTPAEIKAAAVSERSKRANTAFSAVRNDEFVMPDDAVQALRTEHGRGAIREAARRERVPEVRAALNRLADAALDDPSTKITVGMADRISRVLKGKADEAYRGGDGDLGGFYSSLSHDIRAPAKDASPGYAKALKDYGEDSGLVDASDVGEALLTHNTDAFVDAATKLTPSERLLALATGRRALERAAGENPASAQGVARRMATAPEQQKRNAALMNDPTNPNRAQQLQDALSLEERAVKNATVVDPGTGSRTHLNGQDAENLNKAMGIAKVGADLVHGNWLGVVGAWAKTRGMSPANADRLVKMATDSGRLDDVIAEIRRTQGELAAADFLGSVMRGGRDAVPYSYNANNQ